MSSAVLWQDVTSEYGTFRVEVHYDEDGSSCNPREWDHLGYIFTWNRRNDVSDKKQPFPYGRDADRDAFEEWARENGAICYPIDVRDYGASGVVIHVLNELNAFDPEDRTIDGYVYCLLDEYCKEFNVRLKKDALLYEATMGVAFKLFESEIEDAYVPWLNGEVYGYVIKGPDAEEIDDGSCWGFMGGATIDGKELCAPDYCMHEAMDVLNGHLERRREEDAQAARYMAL